jgi:hypothetical protein
MVAVGGMFLPQYFAGKALIIMSDGIVESPVRKMTSSVSHEIFTSNNTSFHKSI